MDSRTAQGSDSSSPGYFIYSDSDDTTDGERDAHDFYDLPASDVKAELAASLGQVPRDDVDATWDPAASKMTKQSANSQKPRKSRGAGISSSKNVSEKRKPLQNGGDKKTKAKPKNATRTDRKGPPINEEKAIGSRANSKGELEPEENTKDNRSKSKGELESEEHENRSNSSDELESDYDYPEFEVVNLSPTDPKSPFTGDIPKPEDFNAKSWHNLLPCTAENSLGAALIRQMKDTSVFDSAIILLSGIYVDKKKKYSRYGSRKVWLTNDCKFMYWDSKKEGDESGWIKLSGVKQLICQEKDCEVTTGVYKMTLRFNYPPNEDRWKKVFINLIPKKADVHTKEGDPVKVPKYKFDADTFAGVPIRDHLLVNSYYILDSVKGKGVDERLGFCYQEQKFVAVRYIAKGLVPLILRSHIDVAVLKRISAKNIVSHMEFLFDRESSGIYVIYEYVAEEYSGINLMDLGENQISEKNAKTLIWGLIRAVEYLHGIGISHGDIRPENLRIAADGTLKLNPLGALRANDPHLNSWRVDTITKGRLGRAGSSLLPPERAWLRKDRPRTVANDNTAGDIWAIGAMLFLFIFGRGPFQYRVRFTGVAEPLDDMDENLIQKSIVSNRFVIPDSPRTSKSFKKLLKSILQHKKPYDRLELSKLRNSVWFKQGMRSATPPEQQKSDYEVRATEQQIEAAVQIATVTKGKVETQGAGIETLNNDALSEISISQDNTEIRMAYDTKSEGQDGGGIENTRNYTPSKVSATQETKDVRMAYAPVARDNKTGGEIASMKNYTPPEAASNENETNLKIAPSKVVTKESDTDTDSEVSSKENNPVQKDKNLVDEENTHSDSNIDNDNPSEYRTVNVEGRRVRYESRPMKKYMNY